MRISSYLPYAGAVVLAALLALGAAIFAVSSIERNTRSALNVAMEENGHGWTDVVVDGLQVHLSGVAPSEATRFRALSVAGSIVDSARVIDDMTVEAGQNVAPPKFSVEILRNDDGVSLIGLMPAATDREAILDQIERSTRDSNIADLIDVAAYPVPDGWDDALEYGLTALAALPRSKISISADRVDITASSDSADQKRQYETRLARARPMGLEGEVTISAPRPVITPFTLRFLIDEADGARFDACSAGSVEGRDVIVNAAKAAGATEDPSCTIGLGIPSPRWPQAVKVGIDAVAELGGGSITYSDADVSLVALDTADQATFDRVVGELEAALPEVFSLHSTLPEPVAIDGTGEGDGPPEFVVTRSPEGQVQLRGRVADDRSRTAAESFAQAHYGSNAVYGAMRLDESLPEGWSVRVLAAIEALSYLNNGIVVAQPEIVSVRGVTGETTARAEISRVLSEKLGEGQNFEIDVSYERKLDPQLNIPTPEECVAKVNAILAEAKINFAPGSTDFDSQGNDTLDRVAAQIKECEDVRMEVGGHTDSQGRTEMNAALSQSRADAVLNGLLARRVLTSALTAHGYGETEPIADNETEEGREANRRIEFKLILSEEDQAAAIAAAAASDDGTETDAQDPTSETDAPNE